MRRALGCLAAACLALSGMIALSPPASARVARTSVQLAPGVTYTRISDPRGPYQIRVLRVDPKQAVMVDVTLATKTFGRFARTSSIGRAHGAIAAVNGDFALWPGRPQHAFARDGTLMSTGALGDAFAISQDETQKFAGPVRPVITGTVEQSGQTFTVDRWNTGSPSGDEIDGYTDVGGKVAPVPNSGCFARLLPSGGPRFGPGRAGVVRGYTVDEVSCQSSPLPLDGGTMLVARSGSPTAAAVVQGLQPEQSVSISWSVGWTDVASLVGGQPLLVSNGKVVAPSCSGYFCGRNPRTGIGVTKGGRILIVTVDGRQSGWSVGMSLVGFAKEMVSLGAVQAMNLDGGGGTTMWLAKRGLVNRPSDWTGEWPVCSAVLVLPNGSDSRAIPGALGPDAQGGMTTQQVWSLMAQDPGSTGGLLSATAAGAFGNADLSPAEQRVAAGFDAANGR